MFRRLLAVALVAPLAALALSVPAAADPPAGSCTAVPNPVPVGTSYTATATGLTVNTAFVVRIQQAGVAVQEIFATSDASGNAATGDYGNPIAQETGTVNATWKKLLAWPSGYGEVITFGPAEADCSWMIVA